MSGLRGDRLREWDERRDVAEALARFLGIERLGHNSGFDLAGHRLCGRIECESGTLRWVVRVIAGWPTGAIRTSLALHEAFAMTKTTTLSPCRGPEAARWKLRMLAEFGFVEPALVDLVAIPDTAPESARHVWAEIKCLLSIRWLTDEPGSPFPLSAPWLTKWTGHRLTEREIIAGRRWLDRHGYITRAGSVPSRWMDKPTTLWMARRAVDG